jgi:hypothetical protein
VGGADGGERIEVGRRRDRGDGGGSGLAELFGFERIGALVYGGIRW